MSQQHGQTEGEPRDSGAPSPAQSFGDSAGQMPPETEVEAPLDNQDVYARRVADMVEEGAPLEPSDLADDVSSSAAPADDSARQLAERTADLQRLQAEYVNYKRRVDRDRDLVRGNAVNSVLAALLPVLDDIDRAREHGELEGGFKAVADSLTRITEGLGLHRFGAPGDPFDPTVHEALMHGTSTEVTTTSVGVVAQAGYRVGDRVVRPAKVTVLDPE